MKREPPKFDDCVLCVRYRKTRRCDRHHFCRAGEFFEEKIDDCVIPEGDIREMRVEKDDE